MKRQMCKLITGLLLALFVAGSHMAVAEAKTLSLGHTGQEVNIFSQASVKFAEYVNEYSDGKIEVKVMGAGALGDNREGIEQLQLGVTDFWVFDRIVGAFYKCCRSLRSPYLFKSAEAGIAFFNSDIAMEIIQPLENKKALKALDI